VAASGDSHAIVAPSIVGSAAVSVVSRIAVNGEVFDVGLYLPLTSRIRLSNG
jgi:hypothetical protein